MKQKDVLDWLVEHPDEADKLRTLLVTKDEVLRRAATLLGEEADGGFESVDENIIGPLTEKLSARQLLRFKQKIEVVMFARQQLPGQPIRSYGDRDE